MTRDRSDLTRPPDLAHERRTCEDGCNRAQLDSAVSIHAVERFLGDSAIEQGWRLERAAGLSDKRVLLSAAATAPARSMR